VSIGRGSESGVEAIDPLSVAFPQVGLQGAEDLFVREGVGIDERAHGRRWRSWLGWWYAVGPVLLLLGADVEAE
jgi:hypothetical protein